MALVPAGTFVMGDSVDGDTNAPTSTVYVSAFYMDTNLVSYSLWQQVYQWAATNGYSFEPGAGVGANYPVQSIDWYDAVKWCNARSQMAGLAPVYYTDAGLTQVYKTGNVNAVCANWTNSAYRLPTEAEWEKAAHGGLAYLRFPWGNTISETNANYDGDPWNGTYGYTYDSGPAGNNQAFKSGAGLFATYTSPVGYFAPNGYGLNDMAGNVFEWCWDWYGPYASGPQTNPYGATTGTNRVQRGGSWVCFANESRTAFRKDFAPNFNDDELGFRTVLPQSP
jgi:formylglycine-generating enzyme required for sulfatase activity